MRSSQRRNVLLTQPARARNKSCAAKAVARGVCEAHFCSKLIPTRPFKQTPGCGTSMCKNPGSPGRDREIWRGHFLSLPADRRVWLRAVRLHAGSCCRWLWHSDVFGSWEKHRWHKRPRNPCHGYQGRKLPCVRPLRQMPQSCPLELL